MTRVFLALLPLFNPINISLETSSRTAQSATYARTHTQTSMRTQDIAGAYDTCHHHSALSTRSYIQRASSSALQPLTNGIEPRALRPSLPARTNQPRPRKFQAGVTGPDLMPCIGAAL